ncbi:MAG: AraC family transcriptional regulator [Bacteroidota bacterium]
MAMFHDFINNRFGRVDRSVVAEFPGGKYATKGVALKIAIDGLEDYQFNGVEKAIKPGEALLMDEGQPFHAYAHYATPQTGICIDVPQVTLRSAYQDFALLGPDQKLDFPQGFFSLAGYPLMQFLNRFQHEVDQLDWEGEGHEFMFMLAQQIARFIFQLRGERAKLPVIKASTARYLYERLHIARGFLHDTRQAPFSLEAVARVSALSEFHLARLFKQCFGQTVFSYHEQLKMAQARELLSQGQEPIVDVAIALGYTDTSYFIRRFKKHFGTTPGKFAG